MLAELIIVEFIIANLPPKRKKLLVLFERTYVRKACERSFLHCIRKNKFRKISSGHQIRKK